MFRSPCVLLCVCVCICVCHCDRVQQWPLNLQWVRVKRLRLRQKEIGLMRLLKREQTPGLVNGTSQSGKVHSAYSTPSTPANITIWEGTQCLQYNAPVLPTPQSRKAHSAYSPPSSSANITISEGTQRLKSSLQFCQHHYATLIFRRFYNMAILFL